MIPTEILKKVRRIQIVTAAMVNDVFAGQYHSAFKGRGMEFEEVREYQAGDDIRSIDWNVTARAGRPFVKSFREERELTVMLLVDVSGSQSFGTRKQLKRELVTEIAAVLALSAIQNNDKVGLIQFSDAVEQHVPPRKGRRHVLRLIRETLYFEPRGTGTDLAAALDYLVRVQTRRCVVFVISDFADDRFAAAARIARRRHDIVPIIVGDERERSLPAMGYVDLFDAERGEVVTVNTSSRRVRERISAAAQARRQAVERLFRRMRVDPIEVETGGDFVEPLRQFFHRRGQRR
ncbi:MAG: DUF58 domain-containing protein [Phycisphaerae bacterium]|nr:DUF58 domain-containing protein [Phycisphaerae bacterium]